MLLCLIIWCLVAVQPEASSSDVESAEPALSQPSDETATPPADEAGQIDDASRLIVGDNTSQARRIGVRTLLRIGSPAAIERLTVILTQPNEGNGAARAAICGALAETESPPTELMEPLIGLIGESRGSALDGVQAALSAFPQAEVQKRLCGIAKDASATIGRRIAVIEMIGRLGEDYVAAGELAGLTADRDANIRGSALRAFSRMTGVEFEDREGATQWWRQHAGLGELKWLARSNQRRREELRALHAERDSIVARLVEAYRTSFVALAEKEQGDRLVTFLKDPVADIRKLGLDLIAAMIIDQKEVSKEVRDAVMPLLSDTNVGLRRQAAVIAGNLRIGGAADVMIASLETETNPRVRAALAGALGRIDDPRAIPSLVKCLAANDVELVAEATLALGSLARRGHPETDQAAFAVSSLKKRYGELAADDDDLREKFLRSMSRIGDESFRPILESECASGRTPAIRIAAIAGLATYEGGGTAEFLTGLLAAEDPQVRGAAIQSLGRSGRTRSHFHVLFDRTHAEREADASVRDKAWEAAQQLFARLSGTVRLQILTEFQANDDTIVQRRRAILARALKSDRNATNELTAANRLDVALMLGDALLRAGEDAAALTELQGVTQFRSELSKDVVNRIDVGLIRSAMRSGQYEEAVKSISSALAATNDADRATKRESMRQCMDEEIASRVTAAQTGEAIGSLVTLIDPAVAALGDGATESLKGKWTSAISSRRDVLIDALLELENTEASIAEKLQAFEKRFVVARIHAKLIAMKQTTSGPAFDKEAALIALARHFVPDWPGYTPGNSLEERTNALEKLIAG